MVHGQRLNDQSPRSRSARARRPDDSDRSFGRTGRGDTVREGDWSGRRDSNPRPSPWQGDALPTEPLPLDARPLSRSGAEGQDRTGDTAIFSRVLYRLSYLGPMVALLGCRRRTAGYHGVSAARHRGRGRQRACWGGAEHPVFEPTAEPSRMASHRSDRTPHVRHADWKHPDTRSSRSFEHPRFDPPPTPLRWRASASLPP